MWLFDCLGRAMLWFCCMLSILCLYDKDLLISHLLGPLEALFHSLCLLWCCSFLECQLCVHGDMRPCACPAVAACPCAQWASPQAGLAWQRVCGKTLVSCSVIYQNPRKPTHKGCWELIWVREGKGTELMGVSSRKEQEQWSCCGLLFQLVAVLFFSSASASAYWFELYHEKCCCIVWISVFHPAGISV